MPTGNGGFSVYCGEGASSRTSIPEGPPEGPFHHSSRWLFSYMLNGARVCTFFFFFFLVFFSFFSLVATFYHTVATGLIACSVLPAIPYFRSILVRNYGIVTNVISTSFCQSNINDFFQKYLCSITIEYSSSIMQRDRAVYISCWKVHVS